MAKDINMSMKDCEADPSITIVKPEEPKPKKKAASKKKEE